ncbi:MAG: hypothetical protein LBS21_05345 [Clostridiales bacterium]|jgi:hypothetical protein|nr:hypothetical protein [Clostridiales bacterium]
MSSINRIMSFLTRAFFSISGRGYEGFGAKITRSLRRYPARVTEGSGMFFAGGKGYGCLYALTGGFRADSL